MLGFIYKLFALLLIFIGGYLLMRFGMNQDDKFSRIVAFAIMPLMTLIIWWVSYRGKKFK
jgi:hypothetical protein